MSSVIFDVTERTVEAVAKQMKESKQDRILVLAPMAGSVSVHAPSSKGKYKGYHRVKLEVWIPEDAIVGEGAMADFGLVTMMTLPKNRVQPHLLRESVEQQE